MPLIFQNAYRCEYPFLQTAQSVIHKYPNPHAKQVVSVDTIDATVSEDGSTLRLERILGIRQNAPKWVQRLTGGALDVYSREVTFLRLPTAAQPEPLLLQGSGNLSMKTVISCNERIAYTQETPTTTIFNQNAMFTAQGRFAEGEVGSLLGRKIERNSWDRFDSNAQLGESGFKWVLKRDWPEGASQPQK